MKGKKIKKIKNTNLQVASGNKKNRFTRGGLGKAKVGNVTKIMSGNRIGRFVLTKIYTTFCSVYGVN